MNPFLFKIYSLLYPKRAKTKILKQNLQRRIIEYYSSLPPEKISDEQAEVLKYLENNPVAVFPYPFSSCYPPKKIEVSYDPSNKMRYVIQNGKRLYFIKSWSIRKIKAVYSDMLKEQDPNSPHRYLTDDFILGSEDVIADIGVAEGNFSLSVIEKVKKIFLIESEPEWVKALEATFQPWKDKVEIINKYAADKDDERHITIDNLMKIHSDISFLKIDVEGYEQKVLDGASRLLTGKSRMKIVICTYHKDNDEKDFTSLLTRNGFSVKPSRGYMIFYDDRKLAEPYLRRGLLRAFRQY